MNTTRRTFIQLLSSTGLLSFMPRFAKASIGKAPATLDRRASDENDVQLPVMELPPNVRKRASAKFPVIERAPAGRHWKAPPSIRIEVRRLNHPGGLSNPWEIVWADGKDGGLFYENAAKSLQNGDRIRFYNGGLISSKIIGGQHDYGNPYNFLESDGLTPRKKLVDVEWRRANGEMV